jgi:hypothetical protein
MNVEPPPPLAANRASFHELGCAARALNNHGASLLERGHFQDVIKTSKDSIGVIKHTIEDPNHVVLDDNLTVLTVNETLHSAAIRLASCGGGGKLTTTPPSLPLPSFFDIVTIDENDIAQMSASLATTKLSASLCLAVRIRDFEQVEQKSEVPYATILYNHGLAHLLAFEQKLLFGEGTCTISSSNINHKKYYQGQPRKHLDKAMKSLSLAHSMLAQYRSQCNDAGCMMQAMLMTALVLRKLIRVLIYMTNKPKEAQEVLMIYSQVEADIRTIQDSMRSMNIEVDDPTIACVA